MKRRTPEEIQAYIDGYNACYEHIHICIKGRKSLLDCLKKIRCNERYCDVRA